MAERGYRRRPTLISVSQNPVSKCNYPRPRPRGSGADGCENSAEDSGPGRQARGVDDGAHGGFALSRPHGPVAVGHLALNDGWWQGALARVSCYFYQTGGVQE